MQSFSLLGKRTVPCFPFGRSFSISLLMDLTSFELQIPTTSAKGEYLTSHLNQVMMPTLYRDRELREDYQNLLSVDPRLVNVLTRKQTDQAARLLTKGKESFRNCEIHSITGAIASWPTRFTIPGPKHLRGVNNDICGALLCSPLHNWDDPTCVVAIPHALGKLMCLPQHPSGHLQFCHHFGRG